MSFIKILVNLVLIISAISVIYIAIHYLIIDKNKKKELEQYEEENDELKLEIGKLMSNLYTTNDMINAIIERIETLEKGHKNVKKRDNIRENKTSNRYVG